MERDEILRKKKHKKDTSSQFSITCPTFNASSSHLSV